MKKELTVLLEDVVRKGITLDNGECLEKVNIFSKNGNKIGVADINSLSNDVHWVFNKDNVLEEVSLEIYLPVIWNDEGAYVEINGRKEYVLVACE